MYTKCAVIDEEDAVQYLEELQGQSKAVVVNNNSSCGDSGLSPESDVYVTPNSSPSEIYHHFGVTQKLSSGNIKSESAETLTNLQKTNQSYYTIVPVEEAFIKEDHYSKSLEGDILEKELAEQDELLKSFHSIKSKEEKKSTTKKVSKPTSLPFTSSQYTKKYKHGCDITYARYKKEGKDLWESKLWPSFCNKEDLASLNNSQPVHKEQRNYNFLRINPLKKDKYLVDKLERKEITIQEEEEKDSSKDPSRVFVNTYYCVELRDSARNYDIPEEEYFMESPGEGMDCELECCKRKDITSEDLLNFPCSPEMDASGGGPDSGLDTSSTGCMPGGDFSSPREHTVSETSGVDLTEAAIGEDMPHDGDVEVLLQKPLKSSTSSSASSDAGTWDCTFPSTQLHDAHVTEVDCMAGCDVPLDGNSEALKESYDKGTYSVGTKISQDETVLSYADESLAQGVSKMKIDRPCDMHLVQEIVQHFDSRLTEESKNGAHSNDVCTSEEVQPQNISCISSLNQCSSQFESNISGSSPTGPEFIMQDISVHPNSLSDNVIETLPLSSEDAHTCKLSYQNNYFINAADLVDDNDMLLPPTPLTSEQQDNVITEAVISELETVQKSFSVASSCEESVSTCDIVNKGITDCLNIKTKYTTTDILPVEAHTDTFCEDVVPFLSSHLTITDEEITVNNLEHVTESNFQIVNEAPTSDPMFMKITPFRGGSGKHDFHMSSGQDIFAEFQKEIKMTEHLEPHVNIRKLHMGWKHTDLSSSDDLSNGEIQSLPTYLCSDSDKPSVEEHVARVNSKEKDSDLSSKEMLTTQVLSVGFNSKESDDPEPVCGQLDEYKEEETEARRPSLIRRNTFELDPDDDRLALLRQEYERRQGSLLFQSCIPQFSGHVTGSEGFRDTQSLLMVTSKDEDVNIDETHQLSLPSVTSDVASLAETGLYVSNGNEEQAMASGALITDSNPVLPSHVISNHDIHTLDSLTNDRPLDSLFHPQMSHITLLEQRSKSQQFCEMVDHGTEYLEEKKLVEIDDTRNESYMQSDHKKYEPEEKKDMERNQIDDLKRMPNSFDNSTKPVISGALTCSDVVVDEKRSCDSPKKQKRTESTPIVSGGVSSVDFVASARPILDSPIMARRKTESAPILSGGVTVMTECEPEKVEIKSSASVASSVKSAWVVDMSDCSSSTSKPPLESRRQKKNDMVGSTAQSVEVRNMSQHKQGERKATALGFFVDLKDSAADCQISKKPTKETLKDKDPKSHDSSPERRNSGVGFFVDLKEHKEPTEKKLSERKETLHHVQQADEPKSVTKNACGFFVNLDKKSVNEQAVENNKLQGADDNDKHISKEKKNTLFSMFINIGDTSVQQESSVDTSQGKVSSPHLSSHKKLGFRGQAETVSGSDPSHTSDNTAMYLDANVEKSAPVTSASQDETVHRKQGFFMFIETESPVTRRKTLPSGLRPNLNRHSWNLEPHIGEQGDSQHKGNGRKHHERAHSLSVDRGSVCSPSDESRSSSSTSLAKGKVRSSSQSLHEAAASSDQGSQTQSGDGMFVKQMSSSSHRQPSMNYDQFPKHTLSYEGKSESSKKTVNVDTISDGKLLDGMDSQLPDSCTVERYSHLQKNSAESNGASDNSTTHTDSDAKSRDLGITVKEGSDPSHQNVAVIQEETDDVCNNLPETTNFQQTDIVEDVVTDGHNFVEKNVTIIASIESETLSKGSCIETESKSLETSFVKLSDLDKEPPKAMTTTTDSSDVLPSFATANRMTRSIPETSWIESKLLMTRSIGGGTSSRSLSRLFPHLHTTMTATSTPSNIGRSKSPSAQPDADDNDAQISETSDLSSMQSSMGPSGLGKLCILLKLMYSMHKGEYDFIEETVKDRLGCGLNENWIIMEYVVLT